MNSQHLRNVIFFLNQFLLKYSEIKFEYIVSDGGSITATSHGVSVSPKEDAELWCRFDGSPLGPDNVSWRRSDFPDFDQRTNINWLNNTSFLTIRQAKKEDIGHFQCVINNGYGNETSKNVFLIVKRKFYFYFYFLWSQTSL